MANRDDTARLASRAVDRLSHATLGTILVVAVAARLAAGLALPAGSTETYEFGRIAENVVDGHGYAFFPADGDRPLPAGRSDEATRWLPSAYMPPLYTSTVVAARWIAGDAGDSTTRLVWAVRGVNLVLAGLGVAAVRALTRRLAGSDRAATLAALGFALYPPLVYAATQVSAANLYVPIQTAALLALVRAAARTPASGPWAVAGVVMGLLALVRAEAVVLLPLVALWLWWAARDRAPSPSRRAKLAAAFVAIAAVLPGAWLVRNTVALGEPTLTVATSGSTNLWIGNHAGASGSQKSFDIPGELRDEIAMLPADDGYELRREAVFRREALDDMTGDPAGTVVRDAKKLVLLLGADVYDERSLNPASLGGWLVLAVIGTVGLVEWWRRTRQHPEAVSRPVRVLVAGFLAVNIAIPVVFFALARYRLPIEVVLLTFAGSWLAGRAERYRTTSSPPEASTVTSAPSAISPSSSAMASGSATWRWITRLSGRAP